MNLEKLCLDVQDLARKTGAYIAGERNKFNPDQIEIKGKANFVSYVDKNAEEMIVKELRNLLPGAGFIAEEGTAGSSNEKYKWVIDPLDGTTNFIHGMPPYAVSICLIDEFEIVLGVVFEISRQECFYAWKGGKAWLNGNEIKVSEAATTADALIATGYPYQDFENLDSFMSSMNHFMKNSHGLRRLGSAATDLAYLAAGRFEGFWEKGLQPWDIAAGVIILSEAGGKASDFNGDDGFLFKGEIVAANKLYFNEFLNIIKQNYSNQ